MKETLTYSSEFMKRIKQRREVMKNRMDKSFLWKIYYSIQRMWHNKGDLSPRMLYRYSKWFIQRRTRGFDEPALWSLDYEIAKTIYVRIKEFRKNLMGCPANIQVDVPEFRFKEKELNENKEVQKVLEECKEDEQYTLCFGAWSEGILAEIEEGFELMVTDEWNEKSTEEEQRIKVERSLYLLKKYFWNLWD